MLFFMNCATFFYYYQPISQTPLTNEFKPTNSREYLRHNSIRQSQIRKIKKHCRDIN